MQQVCDLSAEGDHQSSKTCVAYHRALSCYLVFPERVQRFATGATIGGRDKRSSTLAPYRFVVVMFLECRAKCCSVMHLCKPLVLNGFHRAAYFPPVSLRGLIGHAARSGLTKGMRATPSPPPPLARVRARRATAAPRGWLGEAGMRKKNCAAG